MNKKLTEGQESQIQILRKEGKEFAEIQAILKDLYRMSVKIEVLEKICVDVKPRKKWSGKEEKC